MPTDPECGAARLRADAASNRERIVDAARRVFGRDGVSAPLTSVAAEAGVGIATLYRRFPERDALVQEAFGEALAQFQRSHERALVDPDPWAAFAGLVTDLGEIEARSRGFTHLVQSAIRPLRGPDGERERGYQAVVEVVRRAQEAGVVRAELTPEDLPVISFAIAGILETTRDDLPDAWRRHVALVLDGCRRGTSNPLPAAPAPRLLQRAMIRSARRRQTR
jgi:AcrR family transcriptional regulator